jgi:hypothetical protein
MAIEPHVNAQVLRNEIYTHAKDYKRFTFEKNHKGTIVEELNKRILTEHIILITMGKKEQVLKVWR